MSRAVVVVGAGLAGLAAAASLVRDGHDVTVVEARTRLGGRVHSVDYLGATVERGAEFVLPGDDVLRRTCDELGLRLAAKGMAYGRRDPRGGSPTTHEAMAQAVGALQARGRQAAGATLADALAASGLDPAALAAVRARLEVTCGTSADELSAAVLGEDGTGFGDFETFSVAGGNGALAGALAARAGGAVQLGEAVRRIVWRDPSVTVGLDGGEVQAEACIVAVPAALIASIAFDPPLPARLARAIGRVRYGQAAKLFQELAAAPPPSAVLSVPEHFWSYTQTGPEGAALPVVTSFAGTAAALRELRVDEGAAVWAARVRALRPDLEIVDREPLLATWDDDPWARAAYSAQTPDGALDDPALRAPLGPLAFAGEHTAGPWHGTMEGALRSGERAAADVRRRLTVRQTGV